MILVYYSYYEVYNIFYFVFEVEPQQTIEFYSSWLYVSLSFCPLYEKSFYVNSREGLIQPMTSNQHLP